jgi:anti-sigma factor RsiW
MDALKLQAYLDNELSASEAKEVAAWVARDQQAAALLGELKMAKAALVGNELEIKVPESREFYWSKISREIERQEATEGREEAAAQPWWRRLAMPLGIAAVAVAVTVSVVMTQSASQPQVAEGGDTSTFSFYNEEGNVTVVWVNANGTANGN